MTSLKIILILFSFWLPLIFSVDDLYGLEPEEVLVAANMNASKSRGLALYYMEKRKIPKENLVLLFMTDKETCSRQEYETKAVPPIRRALKANPEIRAIVTMYGLPIRVSSPGFTAIEQARIDRLNHKKTQIEDAINRDNFKTPESKKEKENTLARLKTEIKNYTRGLDKTASFDSALMLVNKETYELNSWIGNPYFIGFKDEKLDLKKNEIIMTSRLDGADHTIVKRIIDDSILAEQNGLKGSAYFDARWKDPGEKKVQGYGLYDRSIHRASKIISKKTAMKVFINDEASLFEKGDSPDTALYCGWYRLARYKDAFTWQTGSVGFHIASSECATLKGENSQVWCKKMLDYGIAATIGPVGEPYVQAFPMPEIFFSFLVEGYLSLAESYLVSLPYLSWKMVLVGDPLYTLNIKKTGKDPHGT